MSALIEHREIRHFHLFCGLGGIDVNAAALKDFERTAGVGGKLFDLFDLGQ